MNRSILLRKFPLLAAITIGALCLGALDAAADPYAQTNLVSDIPGLAAITDPALVNPWGASHSATSPIWVSEQGTNETSLYSIMDSIQISKVTAVNPPTGNIAMPTTPSGTATGVQGTTGQVNNTNTAAFPVGNGGNGSSAHFIFANLNGTISAWDTGPTAFAQVTSPGKTYSGLAINQAQTMIYAANDAGTGSIDVFDSSFKPVSLAAGAFTDPAASAMGLVPFNVQDINGTVYVTYAPSGRPAQTSAALGKGIVAAFTETGAFLKNVVVGSQLAAPWGITFAPSTFGQFADDLLVGNFSYVNSEVNAFDPTTGALLGTIPIDVGAGNTPGGLWTLYFGSGPLNGSPDTLYFADGINGETAGLFGAINVVPAPSALALLAPALALFGLCRFRSRRRSTAA
jgi:uncharacterized protein (TIGR03118 family)